MAITLPRACPRRGASFAQVRAAAQDPGVHPEEESAARERRQLSRRRWADALSEEDDRRDWTAFRLRSWERHPVLAGLRAACMVGAGVLMFVRLNWPRGERPAWIGVALVGLLAASFVLWVVLIRRDED
jgi:hypothetical protein